MTFRYRPLPLYDHDHHVNAIVERMQPLRERHVSTDLDRKAKQCLSTLLANRDQNLKDPESREKMGMIILGESGAGKSRLVSRVIKAHPRFQRAPGLDAMPLASVRLASPVRLKTAGYQTAMALGYPEASFYDRRDYWSDVARRVAALNTQAIHFDETHDIFLSASVRDSMQIMSTFKGLMTRADHPVILVLTGTYELQRRMTSRETMRRLIPISIRNVDPSVDLDDIAATAMAYCQMAGIANGLEEQDYQRIVHAAGNQFGTTFVQILDGVEEALLAGASALERIHLAHAYARNFDKEAEHNVYVVGNFRALSMEVDDLAARPEAPKRKAVARKDTAF